MGHSNNQRGVQLEVLLGARPQGGQELQAEGVQGPPRVSIAVTNN